jgi:hypothetical protein
MNTKVRESKYMKRTKRTLNIKPLFPVPPKEPIDKPEIPPDHGRDWKQLAVILDRIFFIIYSIVLVIFFVLYFPRPDMGNLHILTRHHFNDG